MAYEKIERAEYVRAVRRISGLEIFKVLVLPGLEDCAVTTVHVRGTQLALLWFESGQAWPKSYGLLDPELISPQLRSEI